MKKKRTKKIKSPTTNLFCPFCGTFPSRLPKMKKIASSDPRCFCRIMTILDGFPGFVLEKGDLRFQLFDFGGSKSIWGLMDMSEPKNPKALLGELETKTPQEAREILERFEKLRTFG